MNAVDPFISIIVPCYNQEKFLDETLQSVQEQSFKNWECIIVNDGSSDNSETIILNWTEKDSRFIYSKQENTGVSAARNTGISIAKGDWILALDGDDRIGKQYLELAVDTIQEDSSIDLIYARANFFGSENGEWILAPYNYSVMLVYNQIYCSAIYRKSAWLKAGGYDENLKSGFEDWEFWLSVLTESSKVLKLDYLGFYYRRREDSRDHQINSNTSKKEQAFMYIYEKHKDIYIRFFGLPQHVLHEKMALESRVREHNAYIHKIYKNIFTRILYKLIKMVV